MPSLLCLSPTLLDQSFPRDENELQRVAIALGKIQEYLEQDEVHFIVTQTLCELVEIFEWDRPELESMYPLISLIYNLLNQWILQPHEALVRIILPEDLNCQPHPLPEGTKSYGFVEDWSIEVGKLYGLHSTYVQGNEFFIGIACEFAFSGEELGQYPREQKSCAFPLVGPNEISLLVDAYEWDVPNDIRRCSVSFNDAYNNCFLLGANQIDTPSSGSHYKVKFPNAQRPWPLDRNHNKIPERYLKELIPITNYPLEVIIFTLVNGEVPKRRLKLWQYQILDRY